MKNSSRTKNASRNALSAMMVQLIRIFLEFILRTFFIKTLGSEYLGVSGLFTNILTVLSFAELGIGNAIVFSMYKPILENDKEKVKSLMWVYKKSYTLIGVLVLIIGLILTPFIEVLVKGTPNINENLKTIYILFLSNTAMSYFFMYKKSIILAYQKSFIVDMCKLFVEFLKVFLQILLLIITKNFIVYLIIQILCTFIDNLICSMIANKLFPYIKDKKRNKLSKKEKKQIFSNVKSLVLYKFGSIILNGTDNIIISTLYGLTTVGLLSNFNLLLNTITTLIGNALNGFTASIGNLNAETDNIKKEKIYNELFFLSIWIYGFCAIMFLVLSNDFIELWLGKQYTISKSIIYAMSLHLYINGIQYCGYIYRTTTGLFSKAKMLPLIAAVINIILSIVLGFKFGVVGVLIATTISRLCTTTWNDIYLVHKYVFNKKSMKFYIKYLTYSLITFLFCLVVIQICKFSATNIYQFILKAIIGVIAVNVLYIISFYKTKEFKCLMLKINQIFKSMKLRRR